MEDLLANTHRCIDGVTSTARLIRRQEDREAREAMEMAAAASNAYKLTGKLGLSRIGEQRRC